MFINTNTMKKIFLCVCAFVAALGAMASASMEEVTATYVANPSFEADNVASLSEVVNGSDGRRGWTLATPSGWTVSGTAVTQLLVKADCYTDNNFGVVTTLADGAAAYYLRMGWDTGATTLEQTLKNLPEGRYRLAIAHRTGYANSATSSLTIMAGAEAVTESFVQGGTGFFASAPWKTLEVDFAVAATGNV